MAPPLLLLFSQIILVGVCYAGAATLPLFWDDVTQLTWLRTVDLADLWRQTVPGLNYFRPLAFTIWKLIAPPPPFRMPPPCMWPTWRCMPPMHGWWA